MKHDLNKYKKRLLILSVMLICVALITGVSYALFTSTTSQEDENSLAASCMDMEFTGKNEINLTNTYPLTESEAEALTPYTFTITNKCDNYIEYYVIASVINTSTSADSKYVKVSLSGDTDKVSETITNLKTITTPQSLNGYNIKDNYILKDGDGITKGESRTFNFRMWLDGDSSNTWTTEDLENKTYQVKISVVGTVKTSKDDLFIAALIDGKESTTFPTTSNYAASVTCTKNGKTIDANPTLTWDGSKWVLSVSDISTSNVRCNAIFSPPSLANMILTNNSVTDPISSPGNEISSDSEAVLASTPDDYGTSYYFRGNVQNNYVQFANMCWRIVRILGDGSVKLVLYNYNGLTSANNSLSSSTPCEETDSSAAFARFSGTTYNTTFSDKSAVNNALLGFMYGTIQGSSYHMTHMNNNKSVILNNLESWYTSVLSKQSGFDEVKLADAIWCNDKSTYSGTGVATVETEYSGTHRNTYGSANPSLICPNDNDGGKLSKFTVNDTKNGNGDLTYKIGLLTLDEVVFAGTVLNMNAYNKTLYLYQNANDYWWLLTPGELSSGLLGSARVNSSSLAETIGTSYIYVTESAIRPAIAIDSSVSATGTGTSSDPYVIN